MKALTTKELAETPEWNHMQWSEAAAREFANEFAQKHVSACKKAIIIALKRKGVLDRSLENLIRNAYPSKNIK